MTIPLRVQLTYMTKNMFPGLWDNRYNAIKELTKELATVVVSIGPVAANQSMLQQIQELQRENARLKSARSGPLGVPVRQGFRAHRASDQAAEALDRLPSWVWRQPQAPARPLRDAAGCPPGGALDQRLLRQQLRQRPTRKSLSSGQSFIGQALAYSFVRGQKVVTLSSGEAELVALTQTTSESILVKKLVRQEAVRHSRAEPGPGTAATARS